MWRERRRPGYVRSFTVLHRDLDDELLETPLIVAMVSRPEAVWSPERTGAMSDIDHFRPVSE